MINKSNDLPSFVNENNLPKIVDKLSNASNIKITGNKYGNRVQTVIDKIVEKADDITKAIKQEVVNDSYSFKVGTGNVDVSADVEDGFGEIGVKGVTYQNLLGELKTASTTWQQTNDRYILDLKAGNGQPQIIYRLPYPLKPNTKYTLIYEIKEYTTGYPHFCFMTEDNRTLASTTEFTTNSVGIKTAILTTKSDVNAELLRILPRANIDNTYSIGKNIVILEGDHTNNPNLPSYFEGIVGVGDKSKNLFDITNSTIGKYLQGNIGSGYGTYGESSVSDISDYIPVTANKTYVFSYDFKELLGTGARGYCFYNENKELITSNKNTLYSSTSKKLILTPSVNGYVRVCYDKNCLDIQLEEGSTVTSYEPYYDGHKIEILSSGKNLINLKDMPSGSLENSGKVVMSPTSAYKVTPNFIKIEPTRKVCFYYEYDENDTSTPIHNMIAYYDKNFSYISAVYDLPPKGILKTPPAQAYYLRLRVRKEAIKLSLIFESSIVYEPYVSDKTQILLDEPLMRLPNGVCDEITKDGTEIRRVGKIVLDGSFDFYASNTGVENKCRWMMYKNSNVKNVNGDVMSTICSYFSSVSVLDTWHCTKEGIAQNNSSNCIYLFLEKYSLMSDSSLNKSLLRTELQTNPVTLYYELAKPIITSLSKSQIRIFKDGVIKFDTLVAPESTHYVQLNKSAQIQSAIKESQLLDNKIDNLEKGYDTLMLSTISILDNLELDCTLK